MALRRLRISLLFRNVPKAHHVGPVLLDDRVHRGEGLARALIEQVFVSGDQVGQGDTDEPVFGPWGDQAVQRGTNVPPHRRVVVERLGKVPLACRDPELRVLRLDREGDGWEGVYPKLMGRLGTKAQYQLYC